VWPTLVAATVVMGGMLYFNNVMLPEANHRARQLWSDIRGKRPGFELQPGVFYDGVEDYSILVQDRPSGTNTLLDVTIYDYTQGRSRQAVIKAERGVIRSHAGGARMTLTLRDGVMHRPLPPNANNPDERYEQLTFDRHRIQFNLSDAVFRRSESDETSRSTRTMRTPQLLRTLDSLKTQRHTEYQSLYDRVRDRLSPDTSAAATPDTSSSPSPDSTVQESEYVALTGLDVNRRRSVARRAIQDARGVQSVIQNTQRDTKWKSQRIRSFQVEFYKKFSIALACLVFMFVGAPLGLAIRRGGLATIGAIALGIFIFYWVTLVQGEKLSERGFFPPWLGMWIANILMSGAGIWLIVYVVLDLGATPPLRRRLWDWLRSFRG